MRFGVLGPLEVRTDLGRPVRVPEVKVRTLLAGLLAHQGHVVSADRLIEALWGGAALPANPTASLQAKVSQLRRALEDAEPGARELVQHRPPGYVLRAPDEAVDAGQFRALLARSRTAADPRGKAAVLADALALWRGPAFADFTRDSFVRTAVASLDEARLTAIEEHAEARLELGEHSLVVEELTPVVTAHPLRERLRRAQMHALHRAGRSVEALDSYTDLRRRLREELGLVPGAAIDALQQAILRQDPGLQDSAPAPEPAVRARTNLPDPVNPLVGREQALADGRRLIRPHRLVTLTGAGGVGKTRLALAVAGGLTAEFPDGVWLVELAGAGSADDPVTAEDLARRVMTVLGIREESEGAGPVASLQGPAERLAQTVAPRRLLLVLDNCEHVVDAVAGLVDRLLASGRGVKVLATSQEPLRVSGETVWAVPPLELPDRDEPAHLERSSAVQLFVARAAAADPSFVLDAESAPSVAAVCRRLDGIPLALELAATRVRALGVHELLARLDDRFQILNSGYRGAPPRQQTLQATIDWSWSLLGPQEQVVLRRLAVHAEGCALTAAEELSAGGGVPRAEVVDILARLVDRSLVVRSDGPTVARFRLLESVWVYAQRRLQESGEAEEIAACHARYYTELAERARPRLHGPGQQNRLRLLAAEAANFRQALETAKRTGAAPLALRIVNALAWYWFLSGQLGEACRFLACALETEGPAPAVATAEAATWGEGFRLLLGEGEPDEECDRAGRTGSAERTVGRARAEWFLGFAQWEVGNSAASEEHVNRALLDFRALQDPWGVAAALNSRAALAMARGDLAALRDNALEARAQFDRLGDVWGQLKAAEALGVHAEITADYERAAALHREGLRMAQSLELWSEVSRQLSGLGRIALLSGRHAAAEEFHRRALRLAVEQGNQPAAQMAELGLALGARRQGELETAETHLTPWREWNASRGASNGLALVLAELGFAAELRGDADAALTLHREGLTAALATEDARAVALALEGLAGAHALAGRPRRAARLLGTASSTRARAGAPLPPAERRDVERIGARAEAELGAVYAAEFAAGAAVDHLTAARAEQEPSAALVEEGAGAARAPRPR
ncbi:MULTISPECIES: BTAD domain-containing putative transcriptional regulator [Streptomyces]|uniref:ATPase-like protein n=1 Tax=Streptomyces albus (strain ATCC 21838 / DSM 41398 / FERM P-419 / JCM 4703 / NBRC 107858) TaxID=1081613 RepID=A0A0B5EWS8_STRA4|nr:BTAD domain-containing putative transcriptional regulator [Streptomyces sp. SCSIO ZS0520]AJE82577.1 ATPase-like protein [Streptomyces albus]